jgi:hypothetical protein
VFVLNYVDGNLFYIALNYAYAFRLCWTCMLCNVDLKFNFIYVCDDLAKSQIHLLSIFCGDLPYIVKIVELVMRQPCPIYSTMCGRHALFYMVL